MTNPPKLEHALDGPVHLKAVLPGAGLRVDDLAAPTGINGHDAARMLRFHEGR